MTTVIIIVILCFTSLAFIASPFISGRVEWTERSANKKLEKAMSQKEIYYQAIKDVDFEHAEGKLTEKDYHELRDYYKEKAIQTVKEINSLQSAELQAQNKESQKTGKNSKKPKGGKKGKEA